MTTTINNAKDFFVANFGKENHSELHAYLEEVEADSHWETVAANSVSFMPLRDLRGPEEINFALDFPIVKSAEGSKTLYDIATAAEGGTSATVDGSASATEAESSTPSPEIDPAAKEAFEDSESSELPIVAVFDDGRKFLVRAYLLKSIKQHHRDTAPIVCDMLRKGAYRDMCDHLNLGRKYLTKNLLMLLRGGKISGWFSEFNARWTQKMQVDYFEESMGVAFPNFHFLDAEVSHFYTGCTYGLDYSMDSIELESGLGIDSSVMASYIDKWEEAGLAPEELRKARPICRFITGESGLTSIEVRPYLLVNGKEIPLGSPLSVTHRGKDDAVWEKFMFFPGQVAVFYQKGMARLGELCKQRIFNPYNAATHALRTFRGYVNTSVLSKCAEYAKETWPLSIGSSCYAIEIYNLINDFITEETKTAKPVVKLRNSEMMGRLLHADWGEFDSALPYEFGRSSTRAHTTDDDFGVV